MADYYFDVPGMGLRKYCENLESFIFEKET